MGPRNFKKLSSRWIKQSYEMAFKRNGRKSEKATKILKKLFKTYLKDLKGRPMDGYSFEKLPRNQEGRDTYKIRFSEVFHEAKNQENFSPLVYIFLLIKKIVQKYPNKLDPYRISGFIARGLRSLASFMRESTLEYYIRPILLKKDKKLHISSGPDLDAAEHTDICITFRKRLYRIWTYQYTLNGIPHHLERVAGLRGKLPQGIHVLCPLKSEPAIKRNQLKRAISKKKKALQKVILMQDNKRSLKALKAKQKAKKLKKIIKKIKKQLISIDKKLSVNLEEVNGFYFYSNHFVKNLTNLIVKTQRCVSYRRIKEKVLAPRKMIGRLTIFKN